MNKPGGSDEWSVRRSEVRGALTPELTGMTVYGQCAARRGRQGRTEKRWNTGKGRGSERGRRAIFTVFPSKSPSVNRNVYVGWCNLRPPRHASLGLAWSWRLTQRCEVRGRDGEEGASWWGCHELNKETLWAPRFQCLLSNQQLQTVFFNTVLTTCAGIVKLGLVCLI